MRRTLLSLIAISSMIAGPALAQKAAEGRPPSHCIAFVENTPRFEVIRAAATDGAQAVDYQSVVPPETVRISYIVRGSLQGAGELQFLSVRSKPSIGDG